MKKTTRLALLALLTLLLTPAAALAQEMEVKEFTRPGNDPAATQFPVKDGNNKTCALVIVGLAADDVLFDGDIVKQERKPNGQYWVYFVPGAQYVEVTAKGYLPKTINFGDLGSEEELEGATTYYLNVEVPMLEASFDDLLAVANDYYANYPQHTDFSFYDAGKVAYEKVLNHNDCPHDKREALTQQQFTIMDIRQSAWLVKLAADSAAHVEAREGFTAPMVYKMLAAEVKYIDRILNGYTNKKDGMAHPAYKECAAFEQLRSDILRRIATHPDGQKEDGVEVVQHKRETLSGRIILKNDYGSGYKNKRIFGCTMERIKDGKSSVIGTVNDDGTYSIVKPVNIKPLYVYVTGEKDKAHYVPEGQTTLDITINY